MKKIYSFLLIATALLFSTNAWADNVASVTISGTTTQYETVDAAIAAAVAADEANIQLLSNASMFTMMSITEGQNITLDLNGKVLNVEGVNFATVRRGTLTLRTSQEGGQVNNATRGGIYVYGSTTDEADVVTINIEQGVVLSTYSTGVALENNSKHGYGVTINIDGTISVSGLWARVVNINGSIQDIAGNVPVFNIGEHAILEQTNTTINNDGYAEFSKVTQQNQVVEIWNTLKGGSYTSYSELESAPYVYQESATAIYAAGYAKWNIQGTIQGGNGIYMKSGDLKLSDNAKVIATASEYWPPVYYGNGFYACGVAFVIDNNAGYADKLSVSIKDNVEITAATGPAILEATTLAGDDKLLTDDAIVIEGGTFVGGSEAPTIILEAEVAQNVVENGTITGGNWSDNSVLNYVNESNLLVAELTNDGETSFTLTKPAEGTTISAGENLSNVTASETTNVKLSGDDEETISSNITVAYLEVTGAKKITIPAGKTLTAGTVVLGENAVIDVQAGGKLVVTGSTGIVAWKASNIVLHAAETTTGIESAIEAGQLLLAPEVTSNVHPFGTVEFLSKSYRVSDSERMTQFFGVPMYNANVTSVAYTSPSTYRSRFMVWNGTSYDLIGYLNPDAGETEVNSNLAGFNQPFGYYAIDTWKANDNTNTSFSFTGSFNGNENVNITMNGDWVTLTNAFTGNLKTEAVLEALQAMKENGYDQIDNAVYMYEQSENGALQWNPKNAADVVESISPMAPLMFNSAAGYPSLTINYNNMIYAPATSAAPARKADRNWTKAKIMMEGQGMRDRVVLVETDEDLNAEKYLNGISNIYVSVEKKMGIYASEDVNNTLVGYSVRDAGIYTLTFTEVMGNDLVLVDLANGAQVNIEEGATYTFAASANETNDARFQIVEARKMPTDVETIESAKAQKGIYNMVGAYLGEDFDVLPAGIYVVNGVKVVK